MSVTENDFMIKVKKIPNKVRSLAFTLWFLLLSDKTPHWAKLLIISCLVYFINPADLIPDFLPGGYVDDIGAMVTLLGTLQKYVDGDIKKKVKNKVA